MNNIIDKIVNNSIKIEETLCSHFRSSKSDCSLCVDTCPVNSIRLLNDKIEITEDCIDCGVCIPVCSNDVFRYSEKDEKKIIEEIRVKVSEHKLDVLRFSCEYGDSLSDILVPCLSRLTDVMLIEPIKMGVAKIEILQPLCSSCHLAKSSLYIYRIIQRLRHLYKMIGLKEDGISVLSLEREPQKIEELKHKTVSRREFFETVRTKVKDMAKTDLPNFETRKGHKTFREILTNRPKNTKRSRLLESLKDFTSTYNLEISSKDAILTEIEVTSECTGCGICVLSCPTSAIVSRETEENFYLRFKPHLCVNCDLCLKICKAIRIKERVLLNYLIGHTELKLFEAEKKICSFCQNSFINEDSQFCPLCIDRSIKQKTIIESLING